MDEIRRIFADILQRVEKLEKGLIINKITVPANDTGVFIPKVVSSDPAAPVNNEIWINSTSNQLKWNKGGTIKTINFV